MPTFTTTFALVEELIRIRDNTTLGRDQRDALARACNVLSAMERVFHALPREQQDIVREAMTVA